MKILYGKKTTLFPFTPNDVDYFHELLKHEGTLMGQVYFKDFDSFFAYAVKNILERRWLVWTGLTKEGKASKKFGFIIVTDMNPYTVKIHGVADKRLMKGILPLLKREDKLTFAEDSFRTVIDYLFSGTKIHRVEAETFYSNIPARKLLEKVGFCKEARLREAVKINSHFEDLTIYGLLNTNKEEVPCHSDDQAVEAAA